MSEQEKEALQEEGMSIQDQFFGTTTAIDTSDDDTKPEVKVSEESDVEIKVADDPKPEDKDELEEHSKKVQKRINQLTYEAREAQRQQATAEGVRDEAIRAAQSLHGRNQEYERIISTGEATLVDKIKTGAETAVNFAKSNYAKAVDADDTDALVESQNNLIKAQAELVEANRYDAEYQARVANFAAQQRAAPPRPVQPSVQPSVQRQVKRPDPEMEEWAEKNQWFGFDGKPEQRRDMTAVAFAKHESLVTDEGVEVNSPKYYKAIDAEIKLRFPEYFDDGKTKPSTVVAPAQRNNGATPRKVTITASAAAVAKQLGLSPEEYAQQVLAERGTQHV